MDVARNDGRDGMDVRAQAEGMEGGGSGKDEGERMKDEIPSDYPTRKLPPMPVTVAPSAASRGP